MHTGVSRLSSESYNAAQCLQSDLDTDGRRGLTVADFRQTKVTAAYNFSRGQENRQHLKYPMSSVASGQKQQVSALSKLQTKLCKSHL